jgi:hypothetical protein
MNYVIDGDHVSYLDHHYHHEPQPMAEAHGSSFREIGKWFGADDERVYFMHKPVEGADPASFVHLGGYDCQWAKDRAFAYAFLPSKAAGQWRVLKSRRLDAFAILPGCRFSEYAGDGEKVFRNGREVRGADAASFRFLEVEDVEGERQHISHHFARDRSRVYFEGKTILKIAADASFRVVSSAVFNNTEFGTDGTNAFYKDWARVRMVTVPHEALPALIQGYLANKR